MMNMKTVNITFEDSEFEKLDEAKGRLTWREFFLQLIKEDPSSETKAKADAALRYIQDQEAQAQKEE